MKKQLLVLPFLIGLLASCNIGDTSESGDTETGVTGVSLNKKTLTLEEGEEYTLVATVKPSDAENKDVTWKSSNRSVATVDEDGVVYAVSEGTAKITVTTEENEKTASCSVTVTKGQTVVDVTGIEVDTTDVYLNISGYTTVVATVSPSNATNKKVTWASEDTSIARVSNGKITGVSEGSTLVTATTQDGGYVAEISVSVSGEVRPDPVETQTKTVNTTEMGYKNADKIEENPATVEGFTFTASKNGGATDPAYYLESKIGSVRLYPNNTYLISSAVGKMHKIVFEYESHDTATLGVSVNSGTFSIDTWNGSASSVLFTIANATSGKRSIKTITITYESKGTSHDPLDLGTKTIEEVRQYIANPTYPISVNSHQCGVDYDTTVTIKGLAMAKISLIKTTKAFGLNVSEPSKVIFGDNTDSIGVATKTGDGTLFNKVADYQMKSTSKYTITGYVSVYLGQPEILVESFTYNDSLDVTVDLSKISKREATIEEFYTAAENVNYNCAGHGYGEAITLKGLTCFYSESDGQHKRYYNFTDGTHNIRVNAFNVSNATVGNTYDVTGVISLLNLSPIIVAYEIKASTATPVDLTNFYTTAAVEQSVANLLKVKGSQDDTDTRYPAVVNSYSQISKATGYLCIVEENGKLYVGFADTYKGENFIVGKDNAKANYGVTLIKNDNFWNTTEEKLALFNPYYTDYICENTPVEIYYVNRQLGYKQSKTMWEILLIPQSIPAAE